MTAATLLREAGEALFGPRWQSDLARELDVSDRTVRRWAAGTVPVPAGAYRDMLRLIEARTADMKGLVAPLRQAAQSA